VVKKNTKNTQQGRQTKREGKPTKQIVRGGKESEADSMEPTERKGEKKDKRVAQTQRPCFRMKRATPTKEKVKVKRKAHSKNNQGKGEGSEKEKKVKRPP